MFFKEVKNWNTRYAQLADDAQNNLLKEIYLHLVMLALL